MIVFEIWFRLVSNLTIEKRNEILEQWITETITMNGLQFGGGGTDTEWQGFVENSIGHATESHRIAIQSWLESNIFVVEYKIGDLIESD